MARTIAACALALVVAGATLPVAALADSSSELAQIQEQTAQMAERIESATSAYRQSAEAVEALEAQIADNEARTAQIEAELPAQRERAASSIKTLYIFQQSSPGLLDLLLSAGDFNEFITTVRYLDAIHTRNINEVQELKDLSDELTSTKAALTMEYEAAEQKQDEALAALEEARSAKRELQERADAIAAAEAEARAAAIAAAQREVQAAASNKAQQSTEKTDQQAQASGKQDEAADKPSAEEQRTPDDSKPEESTPAEPTEPAKAEETPEPSPAEQPADDADSADSDSSDSGSSGATFTTNSGNEAEVQVPDADSPSTDPITSNTTEEEASGWAARIDAYLAGSPLAGYGQTFADAAAAYGVDPRLSPAISAVESSKGAVCFLPHNAWGWGSSSWGDWQSAIYDHVAGLASMYGGTLTMEGAQMYCPGTAQFWYSSVLAEMNSI